MPASQLDNNFAAGVNYINAREFSIGLVGARPAASTAGRYYFATDVNGGTLYGDNGTSWVQFGAGTIISGRFSSQLTAVGTDANTAEKVLQTVTVTAGLLTTAGQALEVYAAFTSAANANLKTARIRVGTVTLTGTVLIGGDAVAFNANSIVLAAKIVRTGAATQHATGTRWANDAGVYPSVAGYTALTLTMASAFLIEATGQNGTAAANDLVCRFMTVDLVTS